MLKLSYVKGNYFTVVSALNLWVLCLQPCYRCCIIMGVLTY